MNTKSKSVESQKQNNDCCAALGGSSRHDDEVLDQHKLSFKRASGAVVYTVEPTKRTHAHTPTPLGLSFLALPGAI